MKEVPLSSVFGYALTFLLAVGLSVIVTQLAMLATTVYLHRHLAHHGVELRPEVRAVARVFVWISSGMKPRQWAQVHRYHHAAEDTPNDPHSPTNFGGGRRGARYVLWHNGPLYTQATRDPHLAEKYRDLSADRWDRWFFDRGQAGVLIGVAMACAVMGLIGHALVGGWIGVGVGMIGGLLAAGLHFASYLLAGGVINGFGHASAVRRPGSGYAQNMPVIAWLTVGEGWHRNHHAAENSPRLGLGPQLDLGWVAISGLCHLRLAHLTTRGVTGLNRLQELCAPSTT
jgi:stearoyl-CoA desaturase (delta-9 desaturase)